MSESATVDAPKKARKPRTPRVAFRSEGADLLQAVPESYSSKTHLPLSKSDFADEACYWEHKASLAQRQANRFARTAKECRETGSPEQRKVLAKGLKLREKYQKMLAELQSLGMSEEQILAISGNGDSTL